MIPSNKTIVLEAVKKLIGECDTSLIDTYVSDHYIQHNPTLKDGKTGLLEALTYLKQLPKPAASQDKTSPIMRTIEDGEFVMTHMDITLMGKKKAVIDLYRLEDGKLAEHWDAIQDQPESLSPEITMTNGNAAIEDYELTGSNKELVEQFFRHPALSIGALAPGYIEHNPDIASKTGKLISCLISRQANVHRVIGEGNFLLIQSSGASLGKPFVFYDIVRCKDNLIEEHWSVEQEIPQSMAHINGMI